MKIDMPGIGGSLGECAICGKSFALEVLLGRSIETLKMIGLPAAIPVHPKCAEEVIAISNEHRGEADSWQHLPEGPLRREFAEAAAKLKAAEKKED